MNYTWHYLHYGPAVLTMTELRVVLQIQWTDGHRSTMWKQTTDNLLARPTIAAVMPLQPFPQQWPPLPNPYHQLDQVNYHKAYKHCLQSEAEAGATVPHLSSLNQLGSPTGIDRTLQGIFHLTPSKSLLTNTHHRRIIQELCGVSSMASVGSTPLKNLMVPISTDWVMGLR